MEKKRRICDGREEKEREDAVMLGKSTGNFVML
jgi:hypothetical protein